MLLDRDRETFAPATDGGPTIAIAPGTKGKGVRKVALGGW
jgi:hypothetical protein